jgi:hypothetical protein
MVAPEEAIDRVAEKHTAGRHVERSLLDRWGHRWMREFLVAEVFS